jgi:hypothetical protein
MDEEADKEADEEVEEKINIDNVDKMDGATEAAPDQSAASARPEKLSRLQKACLEFCIALLDHQITRREYDSPLVCALAVLGVKEDGWKGPEQYPPILSAVRRAQLGKASCGTAFTIYTVPHSCNGLSPRSND